MDANKIKMALNAIHDHEKGSSRLGCFLFFSRLLDLSIDETKVLQNALNITDNEIQNLPKWSEP